MSTINYQEKIPNNIDLSSNRRLQRALEAWQPNYLNWWKDMGPDNSVTHDVYLRPAISTDANGWAQFGHVKMPDYRWGIFLADPTEGRVISHGEHKGEPVWQEVPGEYRAMLRRIISIQGDTEPASVEQQRRLGATCPSLYDLRNLYQVNVEEGRHLWAMVHLLHAYFGRDGREEADALLERRSGDADRPRILETFNEETPDWLAFFMFTFFTDRDGKFQLAALVESAFDPLSRTCRFMLTEEAHHMFVGESGVSRIIQRVCEVMRETKTDNPRAHGVIDLPLIQKYLNFHYSKTLDLFGSEESTNGATTYTQGIKGRYRETKIDDDHLLTNDVYQVLRNINGRPEMVDVQALAAVNECLRDDYIKDCQKGLTRWNKVIEKHGIDFKLTLPHKAFNRNIGIWETHHVTPDGAVISDEVWTNTINNYLPTGEDRAYITSIMAKPVTEPGKFANWIAPPARGIKGKPLDFEYVRFNQVS